MELLTRQLSIEEIKELLEKFTELTIQIHEDGFIVVDKDGCDFYDRPSRDKYDFNTLGGIVEYIKIQSMSEHIAFGMRKAQSDMRRALGL
jgi:hypothetical protein